MKTIKSFGIALLLLLVSTTVSAQCTFRNTAFKSGEFLTYNLYYNWKFVWVKAGNASMSIVQTTRHGKPAYRGSLVTRGIFEPPVSKSGLSHRMKKLEALAEDLRRRLEENAEKEETK